MTKTSDNDAKTLFTGKAYLPLRMFEDVYIVAINHV